jgi:hypothetical protein
LDDLGTNPEHQQEFRKEMERFLPSTDVREMLGQPEFWKLLLLNLQDQTALIRQAI